MADFVGFQSVRGGQPFKRGRSMKSAQRSQCSGVLPRSSRIIFTLLLCNWNKQAFALTLFHGAVVSIALKFENLFCYCIRQVGLG